jgi:hypothetical protein
MTGYRILFLLTAFASAGGSLKAQDYNYGQVLIDSPIWPIPLPLDTEPETLQNNTPIANPDIFHFKRNTSLQEKNISAFVARMARDNPDGARKVEAKLHKPGIFDIYDKMFRELGLESDSVADNLAYWWVVSWMASTDQAGELTHASLAKVKLQSEHALAGSKISAMSNSQKQVIADNMAMQAILITGNMGYARTHPAYKPQLAEQVRKMALGAKLDLASMTLTRDGFVSAKRKQ